MLQVFERGYSLDKKEEEKDPELDNTIARLGIAEYQVNKLHRILTSRLDRSNPVTFSKGSSTYAFESEDRDYRITITVDSFEMGDRSTKSIRSFRNAVKSPAFIITCILFSAITSVLALVSLYWTSPLFGTFSDKEIGILDRQYSQILDRCAAIMNDDQPPNPRSFGAQYSTCSKAIVQLQEFCKVYYYQMSTCEDERIELYLTGNKART
ncbi:MAG: hypothetical protein M3251_04620 [Thermoproteota archaeon]|nr:hypothetical protein [Thermoproteota archaeon]